jgi:hypothetical protein
MSGKNGTAPIDAAINSLIDDGILDLGDLEPKTRPVRIMRDGKSVDLPGWFNGDGCPVPIQISIAAARKQYRERIFYGTTEQLSGADSDGAYLQLCKEMIWKAVPALTLEEVETIAGSRAMRDRLLEYLEWIPKTVPSEVRLQAAEVAMATFIELVAATGALGEVLWPDGIVPEESALEGGLDVEVVKRLATAFAVGELAIAEWRRARDAMEPAADPEASPVVESTTGSSSPDSSSSTVSPGVSS